MVTFPASLAVFAVANQARVLVDNELQISVNAPLSMITFRQRAYAYWTAVYSEVVSFMST